MRLFEPENRPLYFKMSATAWRTKCLVLSCEQEGFLSRVVNFMWDTGQCVPDNNDGAIMMHMNVLKFRKVVDELVSSGHITRGQGHIFNDRAMRDIEEWNQDRIKRARAAIEREFEKRKKRKIEADSIAAIPPPQVERPHPNPTPTSTQPHLNPTQPRPNLNHTTPVHVRLLPKNPIKSTTRHQRSAT